MKAEQILQKSANKNMKRWELNTFKITHPTLYKTIIEAISEALIIDNVVESAYLLKVEGHGIDTEINKIERW